MVGAAQSVHRNRDTTCNIRTILQDVCARLDSILTVADASKVIAALVDAFPDNLHAATFTAINTRYPDLVLNFTSDKILLITVSVEACGAGIWGWCNKGKRWIVNAAKLSLAATYSLA